MPTGKINWFDVKKGFGFLTHTDGRDVFIHFSVIQAEGYRRLREGEMVEYEVAEGPRGLLASSVRQINPKGQPSASAPPKPSDPDSSPPSSPNS